MAGTSWVSSRATRQGLIRALSLCPRLRSKVNALEQALRQIDAGNGTVADKKFSI